MLSARSGFVCAGTILPDLEEWGIRALTSQGVSNWSRLRGRGMVCAAGARKTECHPLAAPGGWSDGHDQASSARNGSPFPPKSPLGGFFLPEMRRRTGRAITGRAG